MPQRGNSLHPRQPWLSCYVMSRKSQPNEKVDFFVSRTGADAAWAQWIAWQLEAEGYRVVIQDWDFGPVSILFTRCSKPLRMRSA